MTQPTYVFRWSNYDLERYLRERRDEAASLRDQATDLISKAETIDREAGHLERALPPVESKDKDTPDA